jgi:hypothetical protein
MTAVSGRASKVLGWLSDFKNFIMFVLLILCLYALTLSYITQ